LADQDPFGQGLAAQADQQSPALLQWLLPKILAIEPQQVERDKRDVVRASAAAESLLDRREAGKPFVIADDRFSVYDGFRCIEFRDGLPDRRETLGPVEQVAGHDPDLIVVKIDAYAVAVPLDLMEPALAFRYAPDEGRQEGSDHARDGAGVSPRLLPLHHDARRNRPQTRLNWRARDSFL